MTVRPVHLNGMIQNTQDVSALRHQENQKPAIEQQNIQIREQQKEQSQAQEVHKKDDADNEQGEMINKILFPMQMATNNILASAEKRKKIRRRICRTAV